MKEGSLTQNRRSRRSNVLLKATLQLSDGSSTVLLRNLSQEGALVKGDSLPPAGTRVLFHRQGLSVPSRVAWSHCEHAGIEFDFPLFPREMLRHVPPVERKIPMPLLAKRPGLAPQRLTAAERQLIEAWACEAGNRLGE